MSSYPYFSNDMPVIRLINAYFDEAEPLLPKRRIDAKSGFLYADCPECGKPFRYEKTPKGILQIRSSECRCHPDVILNALDTLEARKNGAESRKVVQVVAESESEDQRKVVQVVHESQLRPPTELEPEALYGLMGEVVLSIEPHTESHPAAILGSFIAGAGCLLGKRRFVYRDGATHGANEFICLVGPTARGRKGTATRRVDEVFLSLYDCKYTNELTCHEGVGRGSYHDLILKGLGSGEALIEALADPDSDRRRLIFEEELSKPLKVMRREGSILSETLRAAWDGAVLSNRTKGRHLVALNAHVSVLAHVTEDELGKEMSSAEVLNGFGNRFLWLWTERTKYQPFGGGEAPIAKAVQHLHEVLEIASHARKVEFDEQAMRMWDNEENGGGGIYRLLSDRPDGLLGAITSRAEVHVTRLALLYSVMDADTEIRVPHLLAALALWDYNERTCRYLFSTSTGNETADTLEELLAEVYPGYLTRREIRDRFQRNARPGSIPKALDLLQRQGKAQSHKLPSHGGPKAEAWSATGKKVHDLNDLSPLAVARRLVAEWGLGL